MKNSKLSLLIWSACMAKRYATNTTHIHLHPPLPALLHMMNNLQTITYDGTLKGVSMSSKTIFQAQQSDHTSHPTTSTIPSTRELDLS